MSDIQTMKDMAAGLRQKKTSLQAQERIFLKVSGLNEEIEKANQEKSDFNEELTAAKERRDDAKSRKAAAVGETTSMISEKMNEVLPFGTAVFSYDEDEEGKRSMRIGWKNEDVVTPYNGLSGMQKQIFDAALANVLDANIIVVEAAELDGEFLEKTLLELSKIDKQVLLSTCHPIDFKVPEPFKMVYVQ